MSFNQYNEAHRALMKEYKSRFYKCNIRGGGYLDRVLSRDD